MKIIFQKEYFCRNMFIISYNDKIIPVYRSSGLSGTGHSGQIFPFLGINTIVSIHEPIGYIYKEMFWNNIHVEHEKEINGFENVQRNMNIIEKILPLTLPRITPDFKTREEMNLYIEKFAKEINDIIDNNTFFDLKKLIKKA